MSSEVVVAFDLVWSGVSHPLRKYSGMLSDVLWCPFTTIAILDVECETLIVTFLPTCSNIKVPFLIYNKVFAKSTTDAWQCDFYQAIMKLANFFLWIHKMYIKQGQIVQIKTAKKAQICHFVKVTNM